MIRVLQVVNAADYGGAETMAMNLYRNINRSEIQFDFTNHKGTDAVYDSEIKSLGGRILHLPKFKGYNYIRYVKAWKRLLREHPEYKIVHIHNYNIAGIVAHVAKQMGVKTIITHSHSTRLNMPWIKRCFFYLFYYSLLNNSTHRFACGPNAGKFLFGKKSFIIVPNAIDAKKFQFNSETRKTFRKRLGLSDNIKIYGHVGAFRTPKNHSFLIDIFAEIYKSDNTAKLILTGAGELMESIKTKVFSLKLNDAVIFAGQQPNVNEWLSVFDVFLMPSLWEGLPVSVIEAQCAGLPCIISDVIDRDVNLTGCVQFLSLNESASTWAKYSLNAKSPNRDEMGTIFPKSPYSIEQATLRLVQLYKMSL